MGAVADLRGRRPLYIGGLAVFALASLASGLAHNTALLIAARGVQGVGGAAMYATTIALLSSSYQGRDRGVAFGVWGAVSGAAAASGPILGGLLTQSLSWRWIFFVNLPISVVAIVMSRRYLAPDRPDASRRLDLPGLATFTVAAAAVTYGLIRAAADGWTGAVTIGLLAAGLAAFAAFAVVEHRSSAPLLDLSLLRRPAFAGVLAAGLLLNAAAFAYLPYTSLWLQTVLGLSPIRAGLVGSLPMSLAAFVISALIGRFLHATNPRWIIAGGTALVGAGALLQATLSAQSGQLALLPGLIVAGIGVGLATPTLVSSAMGAVPHQSGGMAAGAVNTARQLGFTFGVAVLGSAFAARVAHLLAAGGARAGVAAGVSGGQARAVLAGAPAARRGGLDQLVHAAAAGGLNVALVIAGGLGLAAAVIAVVTMRRPASEVAGSSGASTPSGAPATSGAGGAGGADARAGGAGWSAQDVVAGGAPPTA
jgi:EmrB/QacA subfamily drug resistance transporter